MITNLPSTIDEVHKGLSLGTFSAVSLVDAYLARIHKFDGKLNSFITVADELAYKKAKKVDEIVRDNPKAYNEFPLLGVVFSAKDLYLTKGIRTTAASKMLANYIASYSATAVERVENAGAIIIGKTNCDAWAHGGSGENSDFGVTKNPWNIDHVPGGSSSGSAVSVAADFAAFSMGTDTGGSIRQPASFCNVVGLKPTYGAVPRFGVVAMASSLDTIGHLSRTVTDSRRIFNVTKGDSPHDSTTKNIKNDHKAEHFVIGIPKEYFTEGISLETKEALNKAIKVFEEEGVKVKEVSLPHTKYAISVYYIVMPAEVSSNLARYDGVRFGNNREVFGAEAKRRIMLGTYVLSAGYYDAYYLKAMKVRSLLIRDFDQAFEDVDAIIAPVSPTPPFKIGDKVGDPLEMYLSDVYTVAANLAGIPGLAVPCGFSENNLPIGFQLLGARFSENLLFALGEKYQSKTDWHLRKPQL